MIQRRHADPGAASFTVDSEALHPSHLRYRHYLRHYLLLFLILDITTLQMAWIQFHAYSCHKLAFSLSFMSYLTASTGNPAALHPDDCLQ